jgi:hypothetical protein
MWGFGIKAKIIKNKCDSHNLIKELTLFSLHGECEKENLPKQQ